MAAIIKIRSGLNIFNNLLKPKIELLSVPNRGKTLSTPKPRKRIPPWLPKQYKMQRNDDISSENAKFIKEVIESQYGKQDTVSGSYSPLKVEPIEPVRKWTPQSRRTGVIAKKIGIYPMYQKDGTKVLATLLHICDNHVIKYIPPEEWKPMIPTRHIIPKRKLGCLVVGAESADPQLFTKQYCGMFAEAGVMPKKLLVRFAVSPDGALQPGTPLHAAHFKPNEYVDIRAKTIDRGFQGVCKKWGFKGMPKTHGQTKTHRRPGNIGFGSGKGRVMPGTKLPGNMGNRYRMFRGIRILRIDTKFNVIWVKGQALPGETNSLLQVYDSLLPKKKHKSPENPPHFPTYIPDGNPLPDELIADDIHPYDAPTIEFQVEKE